MTAQKLMNDLARYQMGQMKLKEIRERYKRGEYTGMTPEHIAKAVEFGKGER